MFGVGFRRLFWIGAAALLGAAALIAIVALIRGEFTSIKRWTFQLVR